MRHLLLLLRAIHKDKILPRGDIATPWSLGGLMKDDRIKWNGRYNEEEFVLGAQPSRFLAENLAFIASLCRGRKALDIACGEGRNSVFLALHGFAVTGLDISEKGLEKARQ